ncbi:MAG: sigma-70 family RNA polymerase sigma factor [Planctomycetes bacterium]|nr:sigma-70 family RNA polymerase sigma factor [Planctomycetota bacterium]
MPDPKHDVALMHRVKTGDRAAFGELYEIHKGPLFSFLFRMSWDKIVAEDCLQEVFIAVWKAAPTWEPTAQVNTWLFRIARNIYINEGRKAKRRPTLFSFLGSPSEEEQSAPDFPDDAAGPEDSTLTEEARGAVRKAIEQLPEHERMVVLLSEFEGLKYAEIADALDIPVGTVKSRMSSASERLRGLLRKYQS